MARPNPNPIPDLNLALTLNPDANPDVNPKLKQVDEELANLIITKVNPKVRILVLVDACHSGGILDMDTPGLWVGRRVCCISGCREGQLSTDTGDGGAMTNALLDVLTRRSVRWRRKRRDLSVQLTLTLTLTLKP